MHTPPPERICPNCQKPYERDPQFCPHCGFNLEPIPHPKFFAGYYGVDLILALLLCILCAPMMFTAIIPLICFFAMDKRYTGFRRGLAIGLILYIVLILGALAFCGYIGFALMHEH
jgi:hypothetical protein